MIVDDAHFAYLKLQKGALDTFAHDRQQWQNEYEQDLRRTFDDISPALPDTCWGFLDVGSGLGGIDALIYHRYERQSGRGPYVNLIDGVDDLPVMTLHRQTFNHMGVAKDFLTKNGVPRDRIHTHAPDSDAIAKPYDLVVSFGSWCFHYEPNTYLQRLAPALHRDSVLIIDVRRAKPEWDEQLHSILEPLVILRERPKWRRTAFKLRSR